MCTSAIVDSQHCYVAEHSDAYPQDTEHWRNNMKVHFGAVQRLFLQVLYGVRIPLALHRVMSRESPVTDVVNPDPRAPRLFSEYE